MTNIHPTASVSEDAKIGNGTKIWHNVQVMAGAQIGENCTIGHNCLIAGRTKIGNGVKIQSNTDVWDLVTLEDDVFVGPSAVFTNDLNPRAAYPKHGEFVPTLIKKGASIGANATIVCGLTIGESAFIGAGAVVTKDVPSYAICYGNPARIHGWMCACGEKLTFSLKEVATCNKCNKSYKKENDIVNPSIKCNF